MDSMITLLGSIVIGSIFMLNVMTFHANVVEQQNIRLQEMWTQESMATVAQIIDYDFNKIGSGVANPSQAVLSISDSTDITFLADVNNDAVADIVRYYLSAVSATPNTDNPNDMILYRIVNGVPEMNTAAGVTMFSVRLLDWAGNTTIDTGEVASVEIILEVQSAFKYGDNDYPIARWHRRITPANIIRITENDI